MSKVDLNLVRTLITLYETGSVTLAAEKLFLTQPTVSYGLSRLRELFKDPLFVRTKEGMEPTPYARQLYQELRQSLETIEVAFEGATAFDPETTERKFRVALTDIGELALLPTIFRRLQTYAPNVEIEVVPLEVDRITEWLSAGKVDVAISTTPIRNIDIHRQLLFVEEYSCVLNSQYAPDVLDMDGFIEGKHVVVSRAQGHGITEEVLLEMGVKRKVSLVVPHFTALPRILAEHNLIAIVPRKIADDFTESYNLRILPLPFDAPRIEVTLYWSKRTERSLAINWLRGQICEALIA